MSQEVRHSFANSKLTHVLVPEVAEDVLVMARISDEPPLEEGDVENGGVEVDELEEEHFERQIVVELRLGPVHLWKINK